MHIPIGVFAGETEPRALSVKLHTAHAGVQQPVPCRGMRVKQGGDGPTAAEPIAVEAKIKKATAQLKSIVLARCSHLMGIHGGGPVVAARGRRPRGVLLPMDVQSRT